jgi:hypothetical protein
MRSKNFRNRSIGINIRSCRQRPGRDSSCSRVQPVPTGRKRCDGSITASASALLPMRHSRLSVLRRAPPQLSQGV